MSLTSGKTAKINYMNVINIEFGTVTSTLREANEFIMQPNS